MERVTLKLHGTRQNGVNVLEAVWVTVYVDGEQLDCQQLRREHADPAWERWETLFWEVGARQQLSLFP